MWHLKMRWGEAEIGRIEYRTRINEQGNAK